MRSRLREFRSLISLLTTIPVGTGSLSEAAKAFHMVPLVGLIEGLLIAIALHPITAVDRGFLLGSVYFVLHLLVTGGIHMDGFADYSDVLGARAHGVRALEILKDPRKGSYAMMALVANGLLSMSSIALLSRSIGVGGFDGLLTLASVLTVIYVSSAESMFLVLSHSPPEPYEGMARVFSLESKATRPLNLRVYVLTLVPPLALLYVLTSIRGALLVLTLTLASLALTVAFTLRDSSSRLGFANGDVAGFSYELTRVLSLTLVSVSLAWYLKP